MLIFPLLPLARAVQQAAYIYAAATTNARNFAESDAFSKSPAWYELPVAFFCRSSRYFHPLEVQVSPFEPHSLVSFCRIQISLVLIVCAVAIYRASRSANHFPFRGCTPPVWKMRSQPWLQPSRQASSILRWTLAILQADNCTGCCAKAAEPFFSVTSATPKTIFKPSKTRLPSTQITTIYGEFTADIPGRNACSARQLPPAGSPSCTPGTAPPSAGRPCVLAGKTPLHPPHPRNLTPTIHPA